MTQAAIVASISSDLLPFVVIGVVAGAIYGLAATGLVLTYKTSGIFNFAHGAVGAATAYCFYDLRDRQGLPAWMAAVLAVLVLAPILGLALSRLAARLAGASTARRVVATVGVLLAIQGLIQLRYGPAPFQMETSLPTSTFRVAGVAVGYDQLITTLIALTGVVGLGILFRVSAFGLQMRAVVDDPELLELGGLRAGNVRAGAWIIGSAFAGLSGLLVAPTVGLDALTLTLVVVQAFGAAAIGRFTSFNRTFLGGVAIGLAASLLNAPVVERNVGILEQLPALDSSLPFIVLFAVLLMTRKGTFGDQAIKREPREVVRLPRAVTVLVGAVAVAVLVVLPIQFETRLPVLTLGAVFVTIFASLFLLVELSNQVSLCHVAFVAIGATTFTHLTSGAGLPWAIGAIAGALAAAAVGALVSIPAIRLSGLFLALATLGFGILVERMVYARGLMFGVFGARTGARPSALGLDGDGGYFYLCSAVALASITLVVLVRRSRLGRLLQGLAESPIALVTHGATVNITRTLVFCLSAGLAGVAGGLLVGVTGSVSSSGISPSALISFNSLLWLAVMAVAGRNVFLSPVLAAIGLIVAPSFFTDPDTSQILTLAFGLAAVFASAYGPAVTRALRESTLRDASRPTRTPVRARTRAARFSGTPVA